MTIDDVIRAFEAATEGGRDLSDAFLIATGWQCHKRERDWAAIWRKPDGSIPTVFPDPSRNLQHAVDAVPELEELCVEMVFHASEPHCDFSLCWGPTEPWKRESAYGEAPTPALALCLAILRAHKALT